MQKYVYFTGNFLAAIFFGSLSILCLYLAFRLGAYSTYPLDKKEEMKKSVVYGIFGYFFMLFIQLMTGALVGFPITSLKCWSLILPVGFLLIPFLFFLIWGRYNSSFITDKFINRLQNSYQFKKFWYFLYKHLLFPLNKLTNGRKK
jgi:hypothetical protein